MVVRGYKSPERAEDLPGVKWIENLEEVLDNIRLSVYNVKRWFAQEQT